MKTAVYIEGRPFSLFSPAQMERLKARDDLILHDHRGEAVTGELFEKLAEAEIILSGNDLHLTKDVFSRLPKLKLVAKLGVGLDMIDIPAATERAVMVCNTPGANAVAVAEHTFALLLGYLRKVLNCDSDMRKGLWKEKPIMGSEICGKTLGIIGLGAIGGCVATRAVGFEARVIAHDPVWRTEFAQKYGIERKTMHEVLRLSDFVCVHCPLTEETANFIAKDELAMMKPTALLVNMARGGIVKEDDLFEALKEKRIAGAILDAYSLEPPVDLPFVALENVILSPHAGAFTFDALERMGKGCVDQIFEYLDGKIPGHLVNPGALR